MYLTSTNKAYNADPDPVFVLRSRNDDISSLHYYQHCKTIISGSATGKVIFWNQTTQRPITELQVGVTSILHLEVIQYDNNEIFLITHNRSGEVTFWKLRFMEDTILSDHVDTWRSPAVGFCPISTIQNEPNKFWIAVPGEKSNITIKDFPNSCSKMLQLDENKGMIMQMELLALDNNFVLIAGYEDGSVLLWDVEKRSVLYSIKLFDDPIMALCFDYFTMKLLATSATNNIKVIKVEENFTKMELLQSIDTQYKGSSAVKLRNDNKLVFIGGWDGKVRIYNWKNMKLLAVLKYHSETINCLAFDENNKAIVGSKDGKISIWDVYT